MWSELKHDAKAKLVCLSKPKQTKAYNIGVLGHEGVGKQTLVQTVSCAFGWRVKSTSRQAGSCVITTIVIEINEEDFPEIQTNRPNRELHVRLVDISSIAPGTCMSQDELGSIVAGRTSIEADEDPELRLHGLLVLTEMQTCLFEPSIQLLMRCKAIAQLHGIAVGVGLTKPDVEDSSLEGQPQRLFASRLVQAAARQVSDVCDVPLEAVFPILNPRGAALNDDDSHVPALLALSQISAMAHSQHSGEATVCLSLWDSELCLIDSDETFFSDDDDDDVAAATQAERQLEVHAQAQTQAEEEAPAESAQSQAAAAAFAPASAISAVGAPTASPGLVSAASEWGAAEPESSAASWAAAMPEVHGHDHRQDEREAPAVTQPGQEMTAMAATVATAHEEVDEDDYDSCDEPEGEELQAGNHTQDAQEEDDSEEETEEEETEEEETEEEVEDSADEDGLLSDMEMVEHSRSATPVSSYDDNDDDDDDDKVHESYVFVTTERAPVTLPASEALIQVSFDQPAALQNELVQEIAATCHQSAGKNLNAVLFGGATAGKSSVVNTLFSGLNERFMYLVDTGKSSRTKKISYMPLDIELDHIGINIVDTYGVDTKASVETMVAQLEHVVQGCLAPGFDMSTTPSTEWHLQYQFSAPETPSAAAHAADVLLLVVDCTPARHHLARNLLLAGLTVASQRGIPLKVLLTKPDMLDDRLSTQPELIYRSSAVVEFVEHLSSVSELDEACFFPVLTNHNQPESSPVHQITSLVVLNRIAHELFSTP